MSTSSRSDLTRHFEQSALIRAPMDQIFHHIDDHTRLSSHMNSSSWLMGGGKMEIQFDDGRGQRVGSIIRLAGRVFGLYLFVEEKVTERVVPYRKIWETIGSPRLLIIGHYRMGFEISSRDNGSMLRVWIDYALPGRIPERWLGFLFANYYARWCTQRMIKDTVKHFAAASHDDRNAGQDDTQ